LRAPWDASHLRDCPDSRQISLRLFVPAKARDRREG
jgi:hypothetical protein